MKSRTTFLQLRTVGPDDPDVVAAAVHDVANDHMNDLLESGAGFVLFDLREHGDVVDIAQPSSTSTW